jgi:hypothetical protein
VALRHRQHKVFPWLVAASGVVFVGYPDSVLTVDSSTGQLRWSSPQTLGPLGNNGPSAVDDELADLRIPGRWQGSS